MDTELDENDWDGLIKNLKILLNKKQKKIFLKMLMSNYMEQ